VTVSGRFRRDLPEPPDAWDDVRPPRDPQRPRGGRTELLARRGGEPALVVRDVAIIETERNGPVAVDRIVTSATYC
jgi:hypothetical protein